jgi:hypothetical protein
MSRFDSRAIISIVVWTLTLVMIGSIVIFLVVESLRNLADNRKHRRLKKEDEIRRNIGKRGK